MNRLQEENYTLHRIIKRLQKENEELQQEIEQQKRFREIDYLAGLKREEKLINVLREMLTFPFLEANEDTRYIQRRIDSLFKEIGVAIDDSQVYGNDCPRGGCDV